MCSDDSLTASAKERMCSKQFNDLISYSWNTTTLDSTNISVYATKKYTNYSKSCNNSHSSVQEKNTVADKNPDLSTSSNMFSFSCLFFFYLSGSWKCVLTLTELKATLLFESSLHANMDCDWALAACPQSPTAAYKGSFAPSAVEVTGAAPLPRGY